MFLKSMLIVAGRLASLKSINIDLVEASVPFIQVGPEGPKSISGWEAPDHTGSHASCTLG